MTKPKTAAEVIDRPYAMALLRTLNDAPDPMDTAALLLDTLRRCRWKNDPVQRTRLLRDLTRLVRFRYVVQHGEGLQSEWSLTRAGIRAATDGTASGLNCPPGVVKVSVRVIV